MLPHGWVGAPEGVALYETSFRLEGIDPKHTRSALAFDPGRGKANLYLNGFLLGRYWPERGPQRRFLAALGRPLARRREPARRRALEERSRRAVARQVCASTARVAATARSTRCDAATALAR